MNAEALRLNAFITSQTNKNDLAIQVPVKEESLVVWPASLFFLQTATISL